MMSAHSTHLRGGIDFYKNRLAISFIILLTNYKLNKMGREMKDAAPLAICLASLAAMREE